MDKVTELKSTRPKSKKIGGRGVESVTMNPKGGNYRGRPARATGGGSSSNTHDPSTASSSLAHAEKKDDGHAAPTSTTETGDFTIIHAILHNRGNPRLDSVQRLLLNVMSGAATVVRGTDSQRRFTSTYTEFCLNAVRCMADLEEAVFEHTHPGRRAADAAEDEIAGIAEDVFLKQVAAYVSTHTKSLGLAYLEHVALGALEKQQQQQRKRERASGGSRSAGARAAKASRTGGASGFGGASSRGLGYNGGSSGGVGSRSSSANGNAVAGAGSVNAAFDSLGLIDAQDTMREALQIMEQERNAAASRGGGSSSSSTARRRGPQQQQQPTAAVTASITKGYDARRGTGIFVSKAPSSTGDQVVYDLHNQQLKLTSIPELATRLQPWTTSLTSSGVFLERVTMERERKGGSSSGSAGVVNGGPNSMSGSSIPHSSHAEPVKTTLDVCLSPTPMELLRQYEAREAALAAEPQPWLPSSQSLSAGAYSVVPYAGKRGQMNGGSPRSTAALPPSPPPHATLAGEGTTAAAPVLDADGVGGVASPGAEALTSFAFFPAVREDMTLTCLPPYVIANVSHLGVSRMEFVYTMTPTPKQP